MNESARVAASAIRFAHFLGALAACATCVALPAGAETPPNTTGVVGRPNPASQHCVAAGGRLTIEKNGTGGEFGVCTFPGNLQCEEWALMRGECRTGGIKVTGFVTQAARYCAITGGKYKVTSGSNTANEHGTCTFKGGNTCGAGAYFNGTCTRDTNSPVAANQIRAFFACDEGKTVAAVFTNGKESSVKLTLSDDRVLSVPQAMSASGARYANSNESFVFWNKGNTAFIEENGKMTYTGCTARR